MKSYPKLFSQITKIVSIYYWIFIDILSFKLEKLSEIYYNKSIGPGYRKEYETFGISKNNKVLHIGSGSFPLTEISLAEEIGSEIVGIDKDIKAVEAAKRVIDKKKFNGKIKIKHGNGMNYPVKEYDVIIISSCSSPKVKIIKNIFKNAKINSKIIVREMDTSTKTLLEYIKLEKNIRLINKLDHNPFPFIKPFGWQSFYFEKKK